ncbi:MAG: hypothetical protein ACI8XB_000027 [Patiriisocius sp.]|jgi:hypothetical protein
MKSVVKRFLAIFGIRSKYDSERHKKYTFLKKKLESSSESDKKGTSIIIFSKDRAMQLESLMQSYFWHVKNPVPVHVIYQASFQKYQKAYDQVMELFTEQDVSFIKEQDFKSDLTIVINTLECSKILFLVDDLVFKEQVDFNEFTNINPKEYVASLRLGDHLNYAYTLDENQPLPSLVKSNKHPGMVTWSWHKGYGDWAYPLSVDGNLFDKNELKLLISSLDFKAPNSFEESLQIMHEFYALKKGICYSNSIIVNNPCNKVQNENDNTFGEISIDDLNEKWLEGFRIDFNVYDGIRNISAHQELPIKFVKR